LNAESQDSKLSITLYIFCDTLIETLSILYVFRFRSLQNTQTFFTTLSFAEQTVIFNRLVSYLFVVFNPICNKDIQLQDHPDYPGRLHRPEGRHLGPDH
jgi:hypothetical protein